MVSPKILCIEAATDMLAFFNSPNVMLLLSSSNAILSGCVPALCNKY